MKDYIFRKYNTVGEFSNTLRNAKIQKYFEDNLKYGGSTGDSVSFYGTKTYEEADNLLLYGDKNLQKKIEAAGVQKMRDKIRFNGLRKQLYTSVVGFAPNVPAYIAGTPNSMINQRTIKTRQRVITIMYNSSVHGGVSADSIITATSQMISAIMLIEASGVRVSLYCGELVRCRCTEQKFGWLLKVKDSGTKLDTLKMSYPLAHPSMLRRHGFRAVETASGVVREYAENGYGYPITNENDSFDFLKKCHVNNIDKVLCYNSISGKTPEEIVKLITGEGK